MSDYSKDWHEFQEKIRQEEERTRQFIKYLTDSLYSCGVTEDMITPEEACDTKPNTSHKTNFGDILDEAKKIINGQRQNDYGTPEDSFQRIADYWNTYLCHKRDLVDQSAHDATLPCEFLKGVYLTSRDVAMLMILFKIAREEHSHKTDNFTDIIGYAALANNLANQS